MNIQTGNAGWVGMALALGLSGWGCGPETSQAEEAARFVEIAEERLQKVGLEAERANWVKNNFITSDTERLSAIALEKLLALTASAGREASRFNGVDLPEDVARKLHMIKVALPLVAPGERALQEELAEISNWMDTTYGKGTYCRETGECLDLGQLSRILAESRDPDALLEAWQGWRTVSPPMRERYRRFAQLGNQGAHELGFADLGELWRSGYDMSPNSFVSEVDALWEQTRPLYDSLHCYVRRRLAQRYGEEAVPLDQPIPAHLLGNMWAQQWGNIYDIVAPAQVSDTPDLTEILRQRQVDAIGMVRYGERFFTSLGFDPLPDTFWERSLFTQPTDRPVVCHASAWNIDGQEDIRIKMCINVTAEDFSTIHHELGHNIYQRAYKDQPFLYQAGAHDGFHEGIGDTIALSITPEYLKQVGLIETVPEASDTGQLLRMALDKIAFLPFGLMVDRWRWRVFSGQTPIENYNRDWWELRREYQGIRPPSPRSEQDFDPGAKYHIPANTPYSRYFLSHILQFQFHRALCRAADYQGPLSGCSIYGNQEAGRKLAAMLEMGASRPWQDALEVLTGTRQADASAILDYFAPLETWLDEQNSGQTCGW